MTEPEIDQPRKPRSHWNLGTHPYFLVYRQGRCIEVSEADDYAFVVTINVGVVDERPTCTGVDVHSFIREYDQDGHVRNTKPLDGHDGYQRVTSPLWRSIPIGTLIDKALAASRADYRQMKADLGPGGLLEKEDDPQRLAEMYSELTEEPTSPRRGPKPLLTADQLKEMADIYQESGRRGVVAVQQALTDTGYITGAGPGGEVTRHQAANVVKQARKFGLILTPTEGQVTP